MALVLPSQRRDAFPPARTAAKRGVVTNHSAPRHHYRALLSAVVFVVASMVGSTDTRIKTPFQVVPLWSDEMMSYLTGVKQPPCSGPAAAPCERLSAGVCDGVAYFTTGQLTRELASFALPQTASRQAGVAQPSVLRTQNRERRVGDQSDDLRVAVRARSARAGFRLQLQWQ